MSWIKVHRDLLDSEVFASEKGLKLWVWLLLRARFSDGFASISVGQGQHVIPLKRGQLLFGRYSAEDQVSMPGSTIYKWLKKFEKSGMILLESNSHSTVITIAKYEEYQDESNSQIPSEEHPRVNTVTPREQHRDTTVAHKKKSNKGKKGKKGKKEEDVLPLVREVIEHLNACSEKHFSAAHPSCDHIINRINEGFSSDQLKAVVDLKVAQWSGDSKMVGYLRPETLFGEKFQGYVNEIVTVKKVDKKAIRYTDYFSYSDYLEDCSHKGVAPLPQLEFEEASKHRVA